MQEKGVEAANARLLLAGLPDGFEEWKSLTAGSHGQPAGEKIDAG
jgi:hypothetical protein